MSPVIAGGKVIEGSEPYEEYTAAFTVTAKISRVTAAAPVTATLDTAANNKGREHTIVRATGSAADVTVTDGSFSVTLSADEEKVDVYCTGSAWKAK